MNRRSTVTRLLKLDATLKILASARISAAVSDNVDRVAMLCAQWREFNDERQWVIASAVSKDLIEYEIARHNVR